MGFCNHMKHTATPEEYEGIIHEFMMRNKHG